MKLPEEVKVLDVNHTDFEPLVEAIVRDCAKVCFNLAVNSDQEASSAALSLHHRILARYGLESRSGE